MKIPDFLPPQPIGGAQEKVLPNQQNAAVSYSIIEDVLSIKQQVVEHFTAHARARAGEAPHQPPSSGGLGTPSAAQVFGAQAGDAPPYVGVDMQVIGDFAELVLLDQAQPKPANWQQLTTALWQDIQKNLNSGQMSPQMQALLKPLLADQSNPFALVSDWTGQFGGKGIATTLYNTYLATEFSESNSNIFENDPDQTMNYFMFMMSCGSDQTISSAVDKQFWGFTYSPWGINMSPSVNFIPFVCGYYWQKDGGNNAQFQADMQTFQNMMASASPSSPNFNSIYQNFQTTLSQDFAPGMPWPWGNDENSPQNCVSNGILLILAYVGITYPSIEKF